MKEIAAAFVKAQASFTPALKTSENPHFKSRYADLASVIESVVGALNANGIALVQHTSEADKGVIVHTTFLHESGEIMETGSIFFPATSNTPQAFGAALTYARRFSLMAACGIAPADDDNAGSTTHSQTQQTTKHAPDAWTTQPADDGWNKSFNENALPEEKPTCVHGDRLWFDGESNGRPWGRWTCPVKDRESQCTPIWYVLGSNGLWRPQT